ncbi:hypothetical protein [Streptomyces vilmorinianum]|uniref:hypothetical protein n=1 Tax=Streptomyces vilmorinianum TaxID=3051092 RepID=UPI0010FB8F1D|nr:hypothetical protein [Streptomyces vilmorinianum]
MFRTVRALAAFAALVGVVLGLLGCGAPQAGASTQVVVQPAGIPPGCGQGHTDDGAARPATPPRPTGFGELLPALTGERTACGVWGGDGGVRDPAPGPEPPELVPLSPVELSILRV